MDEKQVAPESFIAMEMYATLGRQVRAELDREAEAIAYLQARGYKIIKKEGTS